MVESKNGKTKDVVGFSLGYRYKKLLVGCSDWVDGATYHYLQGREKNKKDQDALRKRKRGKRNRRKKRRKWEDEIRGAQQNSELWYYIKVSESNMYGNDATVYARSKK